MLKLQYAQLKQSKKKTKNTNKQKHDGITPFTPEKLFGYKIHEIAPSLNLTQV